MSKNKNGCESAVRERYAKAAFQKENALCCPVDYDARYLKVLPKEVIEKDYGCGDPSRYLNPGETVLDLGSGTGKICFIAAQVVGAQGRVIGVDMTDAMLEVARRNAPIVAERIGYANVDFYKARIQDLDLDLEKVETRLLNHPVTDLETLLALQDWIGVLRREEPLIAEGAVDVVVSNCVLNLVETHAKHRLFAEIFRVLNPKGGRAVISDIVSSKPVPPHLQANPELWSGCISGALTETAFIEAFKAVGFSSVSLLKADSKPWRSVEGIDFYSVTLEAVKGTSPASSASSESSEPHSCGCRTC